MTRKLTLGGGVSASSWFYGETCKESSEIVVATLLRGPARLARNLLFSISDRETTLARRGFPETTVERRERLERIGAVFLLGYRTALAADRDVDDAKLQTGLDRVDADWRGWAYEGAGMALALRDRFRLFGRGRLPSFIDGPAAPHTYLVHVGAGWVAARLKLNLPKFLASLDPVLGWLAVDGFGFHQGYFHSARTVDGGREWLNLPADGYFRRAHDQGLGRSLFFVRSGDLGAITRGIAQFEANRHSDLFSGVGLAAAYAGGVSESELETLVAAAGEHRSAVAQGVVFAAKARTLAGHVPPACELACRVVCDGDPQACAEVADGALAASANDPTTPQRPRFEAWRSRIRDAMTESLNGSPGRGRLR